MSEVVVAFDFGEKRIGVAVGNTLMKSANPHCIIRSERKDLRWQGVEKVIREWQPSRLVVGRPCHPDGTPHEMTQRAERFSRQLEGRFLLPVELVDERYSSAVVDSDAEFIDDEAAAVILQHWMNEKVGA